MFRVPILGQSEAVICKIILELDQRLFCEFSRKNRTTSYFEFELIKY